jgi:succinate-acetate transporter protein
MAELTDSGVLKEWWANPAVVGLMGFGLTTMATGLHNVGYWSAGPRLALAICFGLLAWYIAMATLANTVYGRKFLPLS